MYKKLFLSISIMFFMLSFLPLTIFAKENIDFPSGYKEKVIEIVKSAKNKEDLDTILEKELSSNKEYVDYYNNYIFPELKSIADKGEVIKSELVDSVIIDDNTVVNFYYPLSFSVTFVKYKDNDNNLNNDINNRKFTPTIIKPYVKHGFLGRVSWRAEVEGYFQYDGSNTPTPYLVNASYKRGVVTVWKVRDWRSGTDMLHNHKNAIVYARGNFYWGAEWENNQVIFDEIDLDLRLNCSKDGNTW